MQTHVADFKPGVGDCLFNFGWCRIRSLSVGILGRGASRIVRGAGDSGGAIVEALPQDPRHPQQQQPLRAV